MASSLARRKSPRTATRRKSPRKSPRKSTSKPPPRTVRRKSVRKPLRKAGRNMLPKRGGGGELSDVQCTDGFIFQSPVKKDDCEKQAKNRCRLFHGKCVFTNAELRKREISSMKK